MEIAFLFYDGMTALDAVGPHEILCRLPGAVIKRVAKSVGRIKTDSRLDLFAEHQLSDVVRADILVVPGAGNATSFEKNPEILDWVRKIHQKSTWSTSVCTGSLILGAAGILSGQKATTHWAAIDRLNRWGAEPIQKRVVESGKIITASGVSAGIDMALTLAAKVSGEQFAKTIQLGIEYDPNPPFDSGSIEKAESEIVDSLRKRMVASFES